MNIYFNLITEFLKIGLFSFGGGYATIPFLYHISAKYGWFSFEDLSKIIAVASITPGPVGINTATYAGLNTAGILGATLATVSEMLPSLIIVIIVSKLLIKFSDNFFVKSALCTLRPVCCALLVSVAIKLLKSEISNFYSIIILLILILMSLKSKKDPVFYMIIAGAAGVLPVLLPAYFS